MDSHSLSRTVLKARAKARSSQDGVALIVVLIFIVALTSMAIYSARDVSLSERLSRNQLDAQVAREAAEAALRDAEFDLLIAKNDSVRPGAFCMRDGDRPARDRIGAFTTTCRKGQCNLFSTYINSNYSTAITTTVGTIEPWWPIAKGGLWNDDLTTKPTAVGVNCSFNGAVPYGTFTGRPPLVGVSRQPEYMIEAINAANKLSAYTRITARGFGRNPNTEVVLQSYFNAFQ
ncbi:MAG: pilus assembly protein PilX [Polaromonas sp.]|nr:pilus assembly protein PilX [Polaromonas sp.]